MTHATRAAVLLVTLIGPPAPERPTAGGRRPLAGDRRSSPAAAATGARMAADALVERLRGLGLEPAFGDSYSQPFTAGDRQGRNVGARLVGADPDLRDEWLDRLGPLRPPRASAAAGSTPGPTTTRPASRWPWRSPAAWPRPKCRPSRSVLFVFFDLEEEGLLGSRHLVREPPVPLEQVGLFITADMLGRSLSGVCGDFLFVIGTDHAPGLSPLDRRGGRGAPAEPRGRRHRPAGDRPERLRAVPAQARPLSLLLDGREPGLPHQPGRARHN